MNERRAKQKRRLMRFDGLLGPKPPRPKGVYEPDEKLIGCYNTTRDRRGEWMGRDRECARRLRQQERGILKP